MMEFYQLNGEEYDHIGTIEDGEVTEGDVDWVIDFVEQTDDLSIDDEEAVVFRVSNQYIVGVVPDGEGDELALDAFESCYDHLWHDVVWSDDTDKQLAGFTESELPEQVVSNLRQAILQGAVFAEFDGIPSSSLMDLRQELADSLSDGGWSMAELANEIQDLPGAEYDFEEAERVARTETQSIVNEAQEIGYEERESIEDVDEMQVRWVGPDDHRNAEFSGEEICRVIAERTEDGVALEELRGIIEEENRRLNVGTAPRKYTPHINCRHRWVRKVE